MKQKKRVQTLVDEMQISITTLKNSTAKGIISAVTADQMLSTLSDQVNLLVELISVENDNG